MNLFYRETLEFRFYQEIWQGLTGRFRILAGVIRGWNQNNPVPVSELYYVGGVNTVRGLPALLHHAGGGGGREPATPTPRCACSRWAATSSWS